MTDPAERDPIAWREVTPNTPVIARDGEKVGRLSEVLGSQEEDIFHGIEVHLDGQDRAVLVPSDDVSEITRGGISVSLTAAELRDLPQHTEEHAFELGWTGLFRKHLGWVNEKDWDK
jgi:hypothetical protein